MFDQDQMARSRIYMSKDINLTNSLLSVVHFALFDGWGKSIQNTWFFILVTLNNIYQFQWSEPCIWMSDVCIWVGRIQARIFPKLHKSLSLSHSLYIYIMVGRSISWTWVSLEWISPPLPLGRGIYIYR